MRKTIKNVGWDVHKNSISIAIADDGREGEVRYYGKIDYNFHQLDKIIRKLISQGAILRFVAPLDGLYYPDIEHILRIMLLSSPTVFTQYPRDQK